jgi:hypothetical protein
MQYIDDIKDGKLALSKAAVGEKDSEELLEKAVSEETEEQAESASSSEEGSQGKNKRERLVSGLRVVDEDEGEQVIHEGAEMAGPDGYLAPSVLG